MKKNETNQFCLDMLFNFPGGKALANLVMALASHDCTSVVELSESLLYHYQYSSLYKSIKILLGSSDKEKAKVIKEIQKLCVGYSNLPQSDFALLALDLTPVVKYHSKVLKDCHTIAVPNRRLPGVKPLSIGYNYSFINWQDIESGWSLPLSSHRVGINENNNEAAAKQLRSLITDRSLPFYKMPLVVGVSDTGYLSPYYLEHTKSIENLVSIIRMRPSMKVFEPSKDDSKAIYGQRFYLIEQSGDKEYAKHPTTKQPYQVWQDAITLLEPDEQKVLDQTLANGRAVKVHLNYWKNMLLRTKDGISMQDKPFNVLSVIVKDPQTGKQVFKTPMYLGVFNSKKDEIKIEDVLAYYLKRNGIEGFFRQAKQKMHMNNYQPLSEQNLDNWMWIIQLASWLLYTARDQVENCPKKWQKYNESEQTEKGETLNISQTRKGIEDHLLSFDPGPFVCRKSKGGPGRVKGQTQGNRPKQKSGKKNTKKGINSS